MEREKTPIQEFPAQRHDINTTENKDYYQYSDRYQSIKSREKNVEREKSPIQEFRLQNRSGGGGYRKDVMKQSIDDKIFPIQVFVSENPNFDNEIIDENGKLAEIGSHEGDFIIYNTFSKNTIENMNLKFFDQNFKI